MPRYRYWWGNSPRDLSERMNQEVRAVRALCQKGKTFVLPGLQSIDDCDVEIEVLDLKLNLDDPRWIYWIISFRMHNTVRDCPIRTNDVWTIRVNHPAAYPNNQGGALVRVISHQVDDSPHKMYLNEHPDTWYICLDGHQGANTGWDPGKSTAATSILWALQWIRTYLYWKKTGTWPDYV